MASDWYRFLLVPILTDSTISTSQKTSTMIGIIMEDSSSDQGKSDTNAKLQMGQYDGNDGHDGNDLLVMDLF